MTTNKQLRVSMHNHSSFSDGSSTLSDMVEAAYKAGLTHYGISDHSFNNVYGFSQSINEKSADDYFLTAYKLKEKYKNKMYVSVGIESEYYKGFGRRFEEMGVLESALDFSVGTVHFLSNDELKTISDYDPKNFNLIAKRHYGGSVKDMVIDYFAQYRNMVDDYMPDICAHLDIIKINNSAHFFDVNQKWYIDEIKRTIKHIKKRDRILEFNVGGIDRFGENFVYPSLDFLDFCKDENIKMTISADAHKPCSINSHLDFAILALKKSFIERVWVLEENVWKEKKL